jgi:hypothetical protein
LLLGIHHLERMAAPGATFALHLTEDEPSSAPSDEVELVPARPDVRPEDPVAAEAVVAARATLGLVLHTA